ncbi:hypothetical protein P154DRAFT_521061 [Amniculicola lignicola CBS 123094]|uniref:AA1-like domain-containing protein n=1 Tax=Amniculicola lignicola CBS 123094 TaxID=1392246 RepID=A0A6A5WJZ7_9PLEO|nr:hypothetical protein P154DRAFT_521061 [Amniculicola lignicola CBS 123094]
MHFLAPLTAFTLLLTPTLSTPVTGATGVTARQQSQPCAPLSYTISNYLYDSKVDGPARLLFVFKSEFRNTSIGIITDPAQEGSKCEVVSETETLPMEGECSTGRGNLMFNIRGRVGQETGDLQIIHDWRCEGQEWLSSTHHKMENLDCTARPDGTQSCFGGPDTFEPENVRRICSTPTCS